MSVTGDIVICSDLEINYRIEIPSKNFPLWFTISSKVFIVVDNICKGYFDVDRIFLVGNITIIRLHHYHRVKSFDYSNFMSKWKYRDFSYTPISLNKEKRKRERVINRIQRLRIPDHRKNTLLANEGIKLKLTDYRQRI